MWGGNFYSTGQQALYTALILPQACLPLALGGEGVHWASPDSLGASLCSSTLWDHPRTEQACLCPFGVSKSFITHPVCGAWLLPRVRKLQNPRQRGQAHSGQTAWFRKPGVGI